MKMLNVLEKLSLEISVNEKVHKAILLSQAADQSIKTQSNKEAIKRNLRSSMNVARQKFKVMDRNEQCT
jgi:hypothetical protein